MERISFKEAPGVYNAVKQGQNYVDSCGLDYKLLELIRVRVSQINSCAYCLDMHYKEAIHAGESPIRLISVSAWRETNYYSPLEQAALAFAETLTHMPAEESSDAIHDELIKYFTKDEIANLTMAIVQINSWNRLVRSFGLVSGLYKVPAATTV
ncbi:MULTISPECIES: carboxymuconolactone decarboxylase family protein [Niastella]|uniref:Carboxymuconolactone decarboxylase family protein n=1 Tax=Niastella soli TaxID=2821487 RepID=A0ABS3Z5F0_9BACT|nr:carboxymuconolactone decarboxylase family protein [Niastella soli]MBO9205368.1 carboxymuconolactone decarboxylase family protein [Niastella soli]